MSSGNLTSGLDTAEPARTVRSADGTTISYFTTGRGEPLIVVPGALSTAAKYASFAAALGQTHTVHTIERRGRGLSGPQGRDYGIVKECQDLVAVQEATKSARIFGHSYGGLIALETARNRSAILKVAVYEPGVSVDGSIAMGWMAAYQRKLAEGKPLDAFATFSVAAGPTRARKTPIWLMKRLLPLFMGAQRRKQVFELLSANLLERGRWTARQFLPKLCRDICGRIGDVRREIWSRLGRFGDEGAGCGHPFRRRARLSQT